MAGAEYPWTFLLDTNVIVKWFKADEPDADRAREFVTASPEGTFRIAVADICLLELANALVSTGRAAAEEVRQFVAAAAEMCQFNIWPFRPRYLSGAIDMALDHSLAIYDAYLAALAQDEGMILVTADRKLFEALGGRQEPIVQWLAKWCVPSKAATTASLRRLHGVAERLARCVECGQEEMMADYQLGGQHPDGMPAGLCEACYDQMVGSEEFIRESERDMERWEQWEGTLEEAAIKRVMREKGFKSRAEAVAYRRACRDHLLASIFAGSAQREREWRELGTKGETGSDRDG